MAEGNIQAARTRLGRAVQRLTAPRPAVYHDRTLYAPSLYSCLLEDLAGTQGDTRTPAKSLPPIWIDASQLRFDIDTQTVRWMPVPGPHPPWSASGTPWRLQTLAFKTYRPQDTKMVDAIAAKVDTWCESIINLLDPESRKFIEGAACPSCGKTWVYRRDSGGDHVRQPALKLVVSQGCTCQACQAFWEPEKFMFLGRLLGYETPEGVVDGAEDAS